MNETIEKEIRWMLSSDTGISSENILNRQHGYSVRPFSTPSDASDFGRCYRLLVQCPHIDINIMSDVDKIWADIVAQWDSLCEAYINEQPEEVYKMLKAIGNKYSKNGATTYSNIALSYQQKTEKEGVKLTAE